MLKKLRIYLTFLICLVLLFSINSPLWAVNSAEIITAGETGLIPSGISISPMMVYIDRVATTITIGSYGLTSSYGKITGYYGETDEVWIYLYLQRYVNGTWQNFNSWSATFNSYSGFLQEFDYVPSGYSYRVKGSYYAWSDGDYEHVYGYSATVYY